MSVSVAPTTDIATCLALRRVVFIEEQSVPEVEEVDGLDGEALHILAVADGRAVGCARILLKANTAKIGRVCVLQDMRGAGLGAQIIAGCLDAAKTQLGAQKALLGSQTHAVGFYEKLGFHAFGPEYDDAGIPHRDMEITL